MKALKGIIFILFSGWLLWFSMPTLSIDNPALYLLLILLSAVGGIIFFRFDRFGDLIFTRATKVFFSFSGLFAVCLLIGGLRSCTWPNEKAYFELIGEVEIKNFEDDVPPIDQSKIIIIDPETAARLGEKTLVADSGNSVVGSQVNIGEYTLQKVNSGFYYIAPTLHKSYWKYRRNKEGTPGYIMVNAVNEKDVQYVDDYKIQYQPDAFFDRDLTRHLYLSGYSTTFLTNYEFEIDDDMNPYWIVTIYDKTIGMCGDDATGCLVVNAVTGEINEYSIETLPLWVDRVHPRSFIKEQLYDWGELVEGFWNWQDLNKKRMTEGLVMTYGQDDRCYYYTGVTSTGTDGATIGFITVDSRTKKTTMYRKAGATEERAMRSAEGAVQEKGYSSSFPRTYNIHGVPTYVMALKDKEGLIKQVAMVSVQNYETVAIGETVSRAMQRYRSKLSQYFADVVISEDESTNTVQTQVASLRLNPENGMMYFHLLDVDKIIIVDVDKYPEAMITQVGHTVYVNYYNSEDVLSGVHLFDNLDLAFTISDEQVQLKYNLENPEQFINERSLIPKIKD